MNLGHRIAWFAIAAIGSLLCASSVQAAPIRIELSGTLSVLIERPVWPPAEVKPFAAVFVFDDAAEDIQDNSGAFIVYPQRASGTGASLVWGSDAYESTTESLVEHKDVSLLARVGNDLEGPDGPFLDHLNFLAPVRSVSNPSLGTIMSLSFLDESLTALLNSDLQGASLDPKAYSSGARLVVYSPDGIAFAEIANLRVIPEPSVAILLGLGLTGIAAIWPRID